MKILYQLEKQNIPSNQLLGLTIGNFDGVHRGHLKILNHLREKVGRTGHTAAITFSNHPSEVLRPQAPSSTLLCPLTQKIHLIEKTGIDTLFVLPFTESLSNLSPISFIQMLRDSIPFTHFILGHDSTIGKNREGSQSHMHVIAQNLNFHLEYFSQLRDEDEVVSSTKIRQLIREGDLVNASSLLGRPYSIYSSVESGLGLGKKIGFPTLNLNIKNLCLPPFGVYGVSVEIENLRLKAIANLGVAPTVGASSIPKLEVHLLEPFSAPQTSYLEVIFEHYIRPERKFDSFDQLHLQIKDDINFLNSRIF